MITAQMTRGGDGRMLWVPDEEFGNQSTATIDGTSELKLNNESVTKISKNVRLGSMERAGREDARYLYDFLKENCSIPSHARFAVATGRYSTVVKLDRVVIRSTNRGIFINNTRYRNMDRAYSALIGFLGKINWR